MQIRKHSRLLVVAVVALSACFYSPALRGQAPASVAGAPSDFRAFLQTLWTQAEQKAVPRAIFDAAFAGLEPDPDVAAASSRQAEFDMPVKNYLKVAVAARRIARGRACLTKWRRELFEIERRFGVPGAIAAAAYGMESDYGAAKGEKDVLRSLATLAYYRADRPEFRSELLDALVMIGKQGVSHPLMKGSWAGAMGGPQFLPSAYLKYAVSYSGQAAPDIWANPLDSLASIANFLSRSGWQRGLAWGAEVKLPENFDFTTLHQSFSAFASQGVKSASGEDLPQGEATLFLPSGASGPALLLSANYWVLKAYNNSDAYAMALALLAGQIEGKPGLKARWPEREVFLGRGEKQELQHSLEKLGFYRGVIDGRFGQASRDAIHDFQKSTGIAPADGFATPELLRLASQKAAQRPLP